MVPEKDWEALEQAEVFPVLGFAARFRNSCQNKTLWLLGIPPKLIFPKIPQQRKLMGSSAQNSSGVHWCRRRVRFNKVPEKVPKVPEKVWEALVQSQVRFNRVPERFRRGSGEGSRKPE